MLRIALILMLAICGCSDSPAPPANRDMGFDASIDQTAEIIAHDRWVPASPDADPFADRPTTVDCAEGFGWAQELLDTTDTIGMESAACNYLALEQPSLRGLVDAESLVVQLYHFQLVGDGPAHAAVAIGGDVVWEKTITIPAASELIVEEFVLPRSYSPGTQVMFHLHNHGLNSWNLIRIGPEPVE